jgi:hypothetical protein
MATIAEKLNTKDALITVRKRGEGHQINDPGLSAAIQRAFDLWRRVKALEAELSEAKALIVRRAEDLRAGGHTVAFEARGITCTVAMRYEAGIPEENIQELKRLLGRRFKDLVRVKTRYSGTSRLVGEAGLEVLRLLRLRRLSPQFKWGVTDSFNTAPSTPKLRKGYK